MAADLFDKFDALLRNRNTLPPEAADPFRVCMEKVLSETEAIIDGRRTILAGTNNYMGMTFQPESIAAAHKALDEFGTGTTGSRVLNGTYSGHRQLEDALRDFYGTEHAMVFSTGYQANLGIISTIAGRGDYILTDADNHASIYDGCNLGQADIVRFRHNDAGALDRRLGRLPADSGKLVVIEGIYSMLGDMAPLPDFVEVCKRHGATLIVDEAHSMGFCGETGRGVAQAQGVEDDVDYIIGTFSKSVGTVGGFCVSNQPKFEVLRLVCRPYMFTASLPPSVVASATASIKILKGADDRRERLWRNAKRLHGRLKEAGLPLATETAESPIIAVCFEDRDQAVRMWSELLESGVYVNLALPPGAPNGLSLLRCSLCASHSPEQVSKIAEIFENLSAKYSPAANEKHLAGADARTG